MKTAILGGGITGLVTADLLSKNGEDWRLFEAASRVGGLCRSETVDGFVADISGGHIIFSRDQEVMDYILEILGPDGHHQTERKSAIYHHGHFVKYPFENGLADLPDQHNFECLAGYVEAFHARKNGADEPEDFHNWCLWRFGSGISEHFMHPYNQKLWNVDLHDMSNRWVSGRIPDAPIEDVIRSSIGIDTEGYKHQSLFSYPIEGGFEAIIRGLANRLDEERLTVGRPIECVEETDGGGYLVDGEPFDRIISTIPLPEMAHILKDVPDDVKEAFGGLTYTSVATVLLAIDEPSGSDRSWIYFPHPDTGPFNRVTHLSNYSPKNAPEGKSSLLAEVTYRGDLDNGDAFQEGVADNLAQCGFFNREKLLFTRSWKNRYAYILYSHDLEKNLDIVRGHMSSRGIHTLGRFGDYNYFNSDACIRAAMDFLS